MDAKESDQTEMATEPYMVVVSSDYPGSLEKLLSGARIQLERHHCDVLVELPDSETSVTFLVNATPKEITAFKRSAPYAQIHADELPF